MVDLALKTLFHDKVRFGITMTGVAFAIAIVLLQVGLFVGMLDSATITIVNADADLWVASRNVPNVDFVRQFPETYVDRVRSTPGIARADNLIVSYLTVSLPTGAQETVIAYALDDFRRWNLPWKTMEGDVDDLKRGPYLFLDDSAAKRFGPFRVGDYREVQGQRLKIIGRTADAKSFTTTPLAFVDFRRAQNLSPDLLRGNTSYILVKLLPGTNVETVREAIRKELPYNDVYTKAEWAEQSRTYWINSTGIGFNAFLTVFLACLIGVVVVAQTLYTSTMENIKEYGTVKAIGGSNADIYRIIGRQAVIYAVVGFCIGVIPAFAMRSVVAGAGLKLIVPGEVFAMVFGGTLILCLSASMVAFRKVAGVDPGLVFRT